MIAGDGGDFLARDFLLLDKMLEQDFLRDLPPLLFGLKSTYRPNVVRIRRRDIPGAGD